jgi:hypothetical protein
VRKIEMLLCQEKYQWWNLGSSLQPTDEKTINGMASSVVAMQEKIQGADFYG